MICNRLKCRPAAWFILVVSSVLCSLAVTGSAHACEDRDRDGFFDVIGCGTEGDCDDMNIYAHPNGIEECNGWDDDCDGTLDEGCASVCSTAEAHFWGDRVEGHGDMSQRWPRMVRARHGYGLIWNVPLPPDFLCRQTRFVRLADDGSLRSGPTTLVGEEGERGTSDDLYVTWAGRDFFVTWAEYAKADNCQTVVELANVFIQRVGPDGREMGPAKEVSCSNLTAEPMGIAWTGRYVILFWREDNSDLFHVGRLTPDGEQLDPCTRTLIPGSPGGGKPGSADFAWNGDELGVIWSSWTEDSNGDNTEIWFERFDEDLESIDGHATRVTFTTPSSGWPRLAWAGSEWGVVFEDQRSGGDTDIAFMRVKRDGTPIDPPGLVWLTQSVAGDSLYHLPEITWTGQEYGVFYQTPRPFSTEGDVWFTRVSSSGEDLGDDLLVSVDSAQAVLFHSPVWNGREFATALQHTNEAMNRIEVRFQRLGCSCTDADDDLYSTCYGRDCDDSDPLVNPGAPSGELCGNQIDDNCDGLTDCADKTSCPPLGEMPGPVTSLMFLADGITLQWEEVPTATAYDLTRGTIANLVYDQDLEYNECLAADVSATSYSDPDSPQVGDAFHYLVRSQTGSAASCQVSTWGDTRRDDTNRACP